MEVIIITIEFHNGLSIIESLGQKGILTNVIDVTDEPKPYMLCSNFVKQGWKCKTNEDAISILLNDFKGDGEKALLVSCSDDATAMLDKHYDELKDRFILPLTSFHGHQEEIMSKQYMTTLAQNIGMNIPETWLLEKGQEIPEDIIYPCITKAISSVAGTKIDNIRVCNNYEELKSFVNSSGHSATLQIQRFIDKAFEFQFLGCSFNDGNEILISGRTHIDRPNGRENTFFLRFDKVEKELIPLENKVREFISETKYNGPFSVEFLRDKNGKDYFTEMNFRNDGNAYCQTCAGINVPYIMYLYYSGGDYKSELEQSDVHRIYMVPEFEYLQFKLSGEFGWKEWYRNMKKANCYNTYFKQDKAVFRQFLLNRITGFLRRRVKRFFKLKASV